MVQAQAGLIETQQEEQRDRRMRHRICSLLDAGSFCLFAVFLARLIPVLVESKPLVPEWQGTFVASLIDGGLLAFMGFVSLHLAVLCNPKKQPLRQRLHKVRNYAVIATTGFLLLIPLQLASSLDAMKTLQIEKLQLLSETNRLSDLRLFIEKADSPQALQGRLQALSEPLLTPEQLSMSLPELRSTLLQENDEKQRQLANLVSEGTGTGSFSPLTLLISRVGSALGWAFGFASGAVPWGARTTLLERVLERRR